jgi:polygalacturonase
MGFRVQMGLLAAFTAVLAASCAAQTLATGDARTVTEPTFPPTCTVVTAQQAILNDAPTSETLYDTSRIQTALTACPAGQAVELAGASGNYAFLSASLNLPSGVSLLVDGGVTLYASRKASDYQSTSSELCGTYGSSGNGCNNFLTFNKGSSNTGSGIYGYGVIDLRGNATILTSTGTDTGISWWTNADQATTAGKSQDNVVFMKPNKSTSLTLYKITIRSSPMFHVVTSNVSGMTVWGVKIQAPFTAHNTDGIDPQGTNITVAHSSLSDGDDAVAVSGSSASSNISVVNDNVYSSHGISIGSYTNAGVSNMLVNNVNMAGEPTDGNQNGLRIKSALDRGGLVQNITYENICLRDIYRPIYVTPLYNTNSGTSYPNFQNIVFDNIHVLATTGSTQYYVSAAGYSSTFTTTMTLDNVVFDQLNGFSPAWTYDAVALIGNVYPASLQAQTGTGVSYTGSATASPTPAYNCSATTTIFPFILGEMYASTATATNLQTVTIANGSPVTLNAMVQPAKSQVTFNGTVGNYTGTPALTQPVNFYEGTNLIGTGMLGANATNNSLATLTLNGVTVGTHTYTAQYPGDAHYTALAFGSITVTVTGASTASATTVAATGTLTYGNTQTLTATVTATGGTPTGTVEFYDGGSDLGTGTLSSGSTSLPVALTGGMHTISAVYSGDNTFKTSTSTTKSVTIAQATTTTAASANPTTVAIGGSSTLTAIISGAGSSVPTGTVSFTDTTNSPAVALGNANLDGTGTAALSPNFTTVGAHTITVSYAGDTNYLASSGTTAVQVNLQPTATSLTAPATAVYGTAAMLTVAVAETTGSGTPTGQVTILDGGTQIAQGLLTAGTFSTSVKLAGGAHPLTATYAGDSNNAASATASASTLTITTASTTTSATANPTTVTITSATTVSVSVAGISGLAVPSGTVTIADGGTALGTITLSGGTGSKAITPISLGARMLTATYSGDGNYAASSGSITITVNTLATTTSLSVTPSSAYPGENVNATATVSPAVSGLTVTFTGSAGTLGTGTTNASGVASVTFAAPAIGSYVVTAVVAASGNYAASSSVAQTLTVVAALAVTAMPNPVSITAGTNATVAIAAMPGGGYSGTFTAACSTAQAWITCTPQASTVTVSGTSSASTGVVIAVAATEAHSTLGVFAFIGLFGLLGLGSRRKFPRVLGTMLLATALITGVSGCGGNSSSTATGGIRPSGQQTVTYTLSNGATLISSTAITVNIQ